MPLSNLSRSTPDPSISDSDLSSNDLCDNRVKYIGCKYSTIAGLACTSMALISIMGFAFYASKNIDADPETITAFSIIASIIAVAIFIAKVNFSKIQKINNGREPNITLAHQKDRSHEYMLIPSTKNPRYKRSSPDKNSNDFRIKMDVAENRVFSQDSSNVSEHIVTIEDAANKESSQESFKIPKQIIVFADIEASRTKNKGQKI